jgi:platelet-activating factor acetylhydrolase IB subunit alpha
LASASWDLTVKIWDLQHFACVKTLHGHEHNVSSVVFSPQNDFILTASRDKSVKYWEFNTGFCKKTFHGHEEWVRKAVFNSAGTLFATCADDQAILIWTLTSQTPKQQLLGHEHVIEDILFLDPPQAKASVLSSDYAASQFRNQTGVTVKAGLDLNSLLTQAKAKEEEGKKHLETNFIASASRDRSIRIWNADSGAQLIKLMGHDNWVRGLALHHSGKYLYSCSDDKSVR